ncbi:peptidyl-tRNA hydrolase, PTH1 family [bacterium A37T11]|nr:peptidyl-tRNA hydrolase, PTH1 family [bacterium A37T11]
MSKYLIVGLGNIGAEYADTRHNIGFMIVDELVNKAGASFSNMKYAYFTEYSFKGKSVNVIKPTTFMNLSGKAVNYWMHTLKIPLEHVLVIVDDLALPFGKIRMRTQGSSAGHNGLNNIEALCGGKTYPRIKFGIDDNFPKGKQIDYVLSPFDREEQLELPALINWTVDMVNSFMSIGAALTMNRFNK